MVLKIQLFKKKFQKQRKIYYKLLTQFQEVVMSKKVRDINYNKMNTELRQNYENRKQYKLCRKLNCQIVNLKEVK